MRWATACRPHVDRCASAWFVRRYVDPHAAFLFLRRGDAVPKGATAYDLPGARLGHHNGKVTFDAFLEKYPQGDAALERVAALVRDIDLGEFRLPESRGLDTLLYGILLSEPDDARVLGKTDVIFEALYRFFRDGARK